MKYYVFKCQFVSMFFQLKMNVLKHEVSDILS